MQVTNDQSSQIDQEPEVSMPQMEDPAFTQQLSATDAAKAKLKDEIANSHEALGGTDIML